MFFILTEKEVKKKHSQANKICSFMTETSAHDDREGESARLPVALETLD